MAQREEEYERPYYSEDAFALVWADFGNQDISGDNSEYLFDTDPDLDAVALSMYQNDENMLEYLFRMSGNPDACAYNLNKEVEPC